jgi:hypothetical protein
MIVPPYALLQSPRPQPSITGSYWLESWVWKVPRLCPSSCAKTMMSQFWLL